MGRNQARSIACAIAVLLAACGGSEDEGNETPAGQGGAGGTTGGMGGAGGMGGGVAPLPADTAGKACAGDTDCAPGTCATMVEGLDGMATPAPGGYCMGGCMTDTDCGANGVCVPDLTMMGMGLCYDGCTADTDCREGYLCGPLTMTCRPAPLTDQLTDNQAGIACAADTECGDGVCLTTRLNGDPFPGGYCSGACLMDSHCGGGGICWRQGSAAGRCYDGCAADAECTRDGYRCRAIADLMGCLPTPDPLPDNTTGIACASDADCGGAMGSCAAMLPASGGGEVAAPGGYCTLGCELDADCGAGGLCVGTRAGGVCFDPCTMQNECREGYTCGPRGGMEMPIVVCTPIEPVEDGGVPEVDGSVPVGDGGM